MGFRVMDKRGEFRVQGFGFSVDRRRSERTRASSSLGAMGFTM